MAAVGELGAAELLSAHAACVGTRGLLCHIRGLPISGKSSA